MSSAQPETCNYIFKAKTKEAFVIKVLSELLSNANIKWAPFRIDNEGIHLSQSDANNHQLISFTLYRENFLGYKATRPINFQVNSAHLYKMLKSIKKKDTLTLFIKDTEEDSCKLGICVETTDENNKTTTYIRITYNQPQIFDERMVYPNPTITSNKEFQKMKNLHNISKTMEVFCPYPGLIKFFCDGGEIYEREVVLGHENTDSDAKDKNFEEYRQTFNTSFITGLTKCANQSGNVKIFVHKDLPLKISMKAGNLGDLTILIKSKERIALELKLEADKKRSADIDITDDVEDEDELA